MCLQVALQFNVARPDVVEVRLNDLELTAAPRRTSSVEEFEDVRVAPDESEVGPNAATETLTTVEGGLHEDDLTVRTARSKRLEVTVLWYIVDCRYML